MSLSATRPVKMDFTLNAEVARIGKRRKITREGQKREPGIPQVPCFQSGGRALHLRRRWNGSISPSLTTEDLSIRLVDRIHHSQPAPKPAHKISPHFRTSVVNQSPDSMLLDTYDKVNFPHPAIATPSCSRAKRVASSLSLSQVSSDSSKWSPLPTLDQVRDSESFEEVKARSTSKSDDKQQSSSHIQWLDPRRGSMDPNSMHTSDNSSSIIHVCHLLTSPEEWEKADTKIETGAVKNASRNNTQADCGRSKSEIIWNQLAFGASPKIWS